MPMAFNHPPILLIGYNNTYNLQHYHFVFTNTDA